MDTISQNDPPPVCCCQVWLTEVMLNCSLFQTSCFESCFSNALPILLLQQPSSIALFSLPGLVALVTSIALGPECYLPSLQVKKTDWVLLLLFLLYVIVVGTFFRDFHPQLSWSKPKGTSLVWVFLEIPLLAGTSLQASMSI